MVDPCTHCINFKDRKLSVTCRHCCAPAWSAYQPAGRPSFLVADPQASYYDAGGISTADFIRAKLTPEQWIGFLLGNVLKYSARVNFKGVAPVDARKLAMYSSWLNDVYKVEVSS
jgi:hypothetical protein